MNRFYVGDRVETDELTGEIVYVDEEMLAKDLSPYLVYIDDQSNEDICALWSGYDLLRDSVFSSMLSEANVDEGINYAWVYGRKAKLLEGPAYKKIPTTFLEGVDI